MALHPSSTSVPFQTKQTKNLHVSISWHWAWLGCILIRFEQVCLVQFFCSSLSRFPTWPIIISLVDYLREEGWRLGGLHWETEGWTRRWSLHAAISLLQPHGNGDFSLSWIPDCKAAHLFSPLHGFLLLSPECRQKAKWAAPFLEFILDKKPEDRAVAFLFLQRNIYGSNSYNLHLSFNILVFFPQGFQCYSCQKTCLISQMSLALLVSFIIFMFSIGSTYISFPSDNPSSSQCG